MQLANQGLYYKGLKTEYEIIPQMNIISSKRNFIAGETNEHFEIVELIYEKKSHVYFKAASLNFKDEKKIIDFCNEYGLFFSTANDFTPIEDYYYGLDKKRHYTKRTSVYDEMDWEMFKTCVAVLRSLMFTVENFAKRSNRSNPGVALGCILTLLIYHEYSVCSILKESGTFILSSTELKDIIFRQNIYSGESEISKYNAYLGACNDFDSSEQGLSSEVEHFLELLDDIEVFVDDYGVINVDQNFRFSPELKDVLYEIAPKIVLWRMRSITSTVTPRISIVNEVFHIDWEFNNLYSYLVMEFAFSVSPDYILAVCQNTKCGSLYNYAALRENSKYCCKECRNAQNKRKQRKRVREEAEKINAVENNSGGEDSAEG